MLSINAAKRVRSSRLMEHLGHDKRQRSAGGATCKDRAQLLGEARTLPPWKQRDHRMALSRAARVIGGRRVFRVTERRGFVSGACQALLRSAEARAARTVLGSAGVLL